MTCRKYKKLFSAYLDGDLGTEQCLHFEDHVAECHQCSTELAGFRKVVALTANLPPIQPSAGFDTSLRAKLTHSESASESRSPFSRRMILALGTVCLLLVILLNVYVYNGDNRIPQQDKPERILIGREIVPAIPSYGDENTFTNFVMPSVPVTGNLRSTIESVSMEQEERTFILPFIMGEQEEQDEPETNYVIRRVSLISTSDETGL